MTCYCYKVVKYDSQYSFVSRIVPTSSKLCCQYMIGKTTYAPEGTGLFAFRFFSEARRFEHNDPYPLILECEYEPLYPDGGMVMYIPFIGKCTDEHMRSFWSSTNWCENNRELVIGIPRGTILCKWVKPLLVITSEEQFQELAQSRLSKP